MAPSQIVITPILLASVDDESREDKTDTPSTGKHGIKAFLRLYQGSIKALFRRLNVCKQHTRGAINALLIAFGLADPSAPTRSLTLFFF